MIYHQGLTLRLLPQLKSLVLPLRSHIDQRLFKRPPDVFMYVAALAGSSPCNLKNEKQIPQRDICFRWWAIRDSNPGHPD